MDSDKRKTYKYCIVPMCNNTSLSTPMKIFFNVPRNEENRQKWCKVMKRDEVKNVKLSATTPLFCCEDHFCVSYLKITYIIF